MTRLVYDLYLNLFLKLSPFYFKIEEISTFILDVITSSVNTISASVFF